MELVGRIENREQAGIMLARKMAPLSLRDAVVVGIPRGGACVAAAIADELHLPLEVLSCRRIKHPANSGLNLGSVSLGEIIVHECPRELPQDYLQFQAARLKAEIAADNHFYYGQQDAPQLQHKTAIVVDDVLTSADTLLACIRDLKKHRALKVVVAIPFVQAEAARVIQAEVDLLVFLKMQHTISNPRAFYVDFPEVNDWTVRSLLKRSKGELVPVCKQ